MREYPILFTGAMVRAILEGRKRQTRRLWKMPCGLDWYVSGCMRGEETGDIHDPATSWWGHVEEMACPHGQAGDRLYVREAWRTTEDLDPYSGGHIGVMSQVAGYTTPWAPIQYEADGWRSRWEHTSTPPHAADPNPGRYRHARFMPRWACRLLLEITGVRAERLQEISETDAIAEGIRPYKDGWERFHPDPADAEHTGATKDPRLAYKGLWEQINGAGAWDVNPWVWVVEFRPLEAGGVR
ncbi:hypothetical protein [Cupriavidus necator]